MATGGHKHTNRLARESSPYLLQHAHNPVEWWPWGEEAFAEARRRDVPILLSVGYSTCYWCHVMERESFESEEIARGLNERFVCVKVDREERPDVDDLYMTATQAMTGSGGWPMTVFLEPGGLKPFWCGTYFPPAPWHGRPGLPQVAEAIDKAWREEREGVLRQAAELAEAVRERVGGDRDRSAVRIGAEDVAEAVTQLLRMHDRVNGGFGPASGPKFPQPVYLELLLDFLPRTGDEDAREAVEAALRLTLDRMALGGMFDHVGGGFHRYSVDGQWIVPHFEKMLYDQGQLAAVYARASVLLKEPWYGEVAGRVCEYVLREMRGERTLTPPLRSDPLPVSTQGESGSFWSAQDAEVDGREGLNYLWTPDEVRAALSAEDAALALKVYGLDRPANFQDPHHPKEPRRWVLTMADRPERVAARLGMSGEQFAAAMVRINARLYEVRMQRKQPRMDTKVLAAWNGMMIEGLAAAGHLVGNDGWINAAAGAARSLLRDLRGSDGGLLRTRGREIPAFLEDYAALIRGLIEVRLAGGDRDGTLLKEARRLAEEVERRFGDPASGGWFDVEVGAGDLFVRAAGEYDGAVPSGGSMMVNALVDLAGLEGAPSGLADSATSPVRSGGGATKRALGGLGAVSRFLSQSPVAAAGSTRALLRLMVLAPREVAEFFGGKPGSGRAGAEPGDDVVEVLAATDHIELKGDEPGVLMLKLKIAPGYHVTAAEQEHDMLGVMPMRVFVAGGGGVRAYVSWPPARDYRPEWVESAGGERPSVKVYEGEVEMAVGLVREGKWTGRPVLALTYQACSHFACLRPRTVELDVAIDRAG